MPFESFSKSPAEKKYFFCFFMHTFFKHAILLVSKLTPVKTATRTLQRHFCAPDLEQISMLMRDLIDWFKQILNLKNSA